LWVLLTAVSSAAAAEVESLLRTAKGFSSEQASVLLWRQLLLNEKAAFGWRFDVSSQVSTLTAPPPQQHRSLHRRCRQYLSRLCCAAIVEVMMTKRSQE
jgi:hypothetical protein